MTSAQSPSDEPRKSAEDILKEIRTRTKDLWTKFDSPEELSRLINELAVLSFGLGEWLTIFDDEERNMKTELDLEKATIISELVDKKEPVSKAEVKATVKLGEKRREYNQTVTMVNKLKIARHDVENLIDTGRSRLSLIKQDMEKS